jgi:hypothetical protein
MKKVLRILGLVILTPLCMYWVYSAVFHTMEYVKGNDYVDYLNNNKTVFNSDFELDASFYEKQFYIVGEIHGFAKSPEIDFKLFKHLNKRIGVRYYMSEVDFSQAYYLNQYLETGNDSIIHYALENWLVVQAQNNRDYYQKWKELYKYNKSLPKEKKIVVLGCDVVSDMTLFKDHLKSLLDTIDYTAVFANAKKRVEFVKRIKSFKGDLQKQNSFKSKYGSGFAEISHLMETMLQTELSGREEKIFTNFKKLIKTYELENEKIYSFYGNFHALQASTSDGFEPLAAKIKRSDLAMGQNMVSLNMLFNDSEMIMPSNGLPSYLQTGPNWSEVAFKYDSLLLFYLQGIKDLMRTSEESSVTFYKMNGINTPYENTNRLMNVKMLLPFLENQKIEIDEKLGSVDYSQYLIFVRNSEAAQPYQF